MKSTGYDGEVSESTEASGGRSEEAPRLRVPSEQSPEKVMCFGRMFEISEGMGYLTRLQILVGLYTFLGIFYQMAINPFKDDAKIWIFHFANLAINLPRVYSGYLCYKWIMWDSIETRRGLCTSFLIWLSIDIMLIFQYFVLNQLLFGTYYKSYIF